MDLTGIVASYTKQDGKTVDLENLVKDESFQTTAVTAILQEVKNKVGVCVIFPSYPKNAALGQLINELAKSLKVRAIVTGGVENLHRVARSNKKEVLLIKQAFRTGKELSEQVAAIKKMGAKASVLCLVSHSSVKLKRFAMNNDVEMTSLVYPNDLGACKIIPQD